VKEQQKRIGAAEFRNTHFSYTIGTEGVEKFVSTPAFAGVAKQVRTAIEVATKVAGIGLSSTPVASAGAPSTRGSVRTEQFPRSSNLRLTKTFTEKDRDDFLRDAFEFAAKFFEGSLKALCERNAGTSQTFDRIDSRRFAAILYREGQSVAQGSVRLDSLGGRNSSCIAFSYDASARPGSSNEMLNVESTDQALFFKPMGLAWSGGDRGQHLSIEGAAEYLWAMFIRPAQEN
jgi:hypothetical protein